MIVWVVTLVLAAGSGATPDVFDTDPSAGRDGGSPASAFFVSRRTDPVTSEESIELHIIRIFNLAEYGLPAVVFNLPESVACRTRQ